MSDTQCGKLGEIHRDLRRLSLALASSTAETAGVRVVAQLSAAARPLAPVAAAVTDELASTTRALIRGAVAGTATARSGITRTIWNEF
jgi:hypothetical protein